MIEELNPSNKVNELIYKIPNIIQYGHTLVLKGYNEIFSCLYDVLNCRYELRQGLKFSHLFYGDYNQPVKVHDDFKFILIVDTEELDISSTPEVAFKEVIE